MSEYWKSTPRKFCEICKCWFADNRASIEFHEKGKNHQENVKKRIDQIQKKGLKDFKAKQKYESEMEKIEKAAAAAFKKDLQQNPELAAQYNYKVTDLTTPKDIETKPIICNEKDAAIDAERNKKQNSGKKASKGKDKNTSSQDSVSSFGPQPKPDPYGSWVPVDNEPEEQIDWQLPASSENFSAVYVPTVTEEVVKIKEKIVGHLGEAFGSGECTFKKRKNLANTKRNVRQRLDD